ncbi:lipid-A-disaccharide synthase [Candidatus Margulisiibacteriota bacterium]
MLKKLFISAPDPSGDMYAAHLIDALHKRLPDMDISAVGGEQLRKLGVTLIAEPVFLNVVGFFESLLKLPFFISLLRKVVSYIQSWQPDVVLCIDSQGFHMPLLKKIKLFPCKKYYFIAPQEWQWGTEQGGKKVVQLVDHIFTIFREEEAFYQNLDASTTFVGHPLLDVVHDCTSTPETTAPTIGIFPGSRKQEIKTLLPIFLKSISHIQHSYTSPIHFIISASSDEAEQLIQKLCHRYKQFYSIQRDRFDLLSKSLFCICASGTITLETGLCSIPTIVCYRTHFITYLIYRMFIRKKIPYASLTNIYLKSLVFPECLQYRCTPSTISDIALQYLNDPSSLERIKNELAPLREKVGEPGAIHNLTAALLAL